MVIAGAGGHGLEVYWVLISQGIPASEIYFFDEDSSKKNTYSHHDKVLSSEEELKDVLSLKPEFCLGVGNPVSRKNLCDKLEKMGGKHFFILSPTAVNQSFSPKSADLMDFAFCGPETEVGKGVLVNVRGHVHHECKIGDYTEIGPSAILLGGVKVGKLCRIGAGAVLLPGIEIGDEVVVGAGAVVTKNFLNKSVLKGVPASDQ